jgi:ribosomal protein S18 acetylase RimI-like enzyme
MGPQIRVFAEDDIAAAIGLWQATEGIGMTEADSPAGIAQFLRRNPGLSLVAHEGGEMVATLLCGHDGRRGTLYHLVVRESHRRSGLGRTLVRRCLSGLRAVGVLRCNLFTFRENTPARGFWVRIGGEERTGLVAYSLATGEGCGSSRC